MISTTLEHRLFDFTWLNIFIIDMCLISSMFHLTIHLLCFHGACDNIVDSCEGVWSWVVGLLREAGWASTTVLRADIGQSSEQGQTHTLQHYTHTHTLRSTHTCCVDIHTYIYITYTNTKTYPSSTHTNTQTLLLHNKPHTHLSSSSDVTP